MINTNIEKLGGAVGIDTQLGVGTTIDVKLPLTLAIIPSLIVRCEGNRFAIPQSNIGELVRLKAADVSSKIERIKDAEVFRLRGSLLPLVRLALGADRVGPVQVVELRAAVETGPLGPEPGLLLGALQRLRDSLSRLSAGGLRDFPGG